MRRRRCHRRRGPTLKSDLGLWAQALVEAEESSTQLVSEHARRSAKAEQLAAPGSLKCKPLRSELGRRAQAAVEALGTGAPALQSELGQWAEEAASAEGRSKAAAPSGGARRPRPGRRCHRRRRHGDSTTQVLSPQLRPLRSQLGRFAEALCSGGPVLQSELGRWAEELVRTEEWLKAQPPPCEPCAVDIDGVVHGADTIRALSAADGYARAARLKHFHKRWRARQARAAEPGSRLAASAEGEVRQAAPAAQGFNFGAALRLQERLAKRRAREASIGWWEDLLFVDDMGVVQGFRPL
mmetsp:Transcript_45278/g.135352  ORF Transcript_45278/g.135352 Transcript_45278/m.135352 type:complete len:297 (-) Transcript_45278:61-951(-)